MSSTNPFETHKQEKKASSKGFYIALAVCLVAVCGVAVSSFVGSVSTEKEGAGSSTVQSVTTTAKAVALPATNIPDTRTTTSTETTTTSTATTKSANLFVFPASNVVSQTYSDQPVFSETLQAWNTHNGVDFSADKGSEVKALADGTITAVRQDVLWGDCIEIDHGNKIVTRYYGVAAKNITENQSVKAGEVIGTVTEIPAEILEPSHIHVEICANGNFVNPMTLIRGETVTAKKTTTAVTAGTTSATKK